MFGLIRWNPFEGIFDLRREIDDVFRRAFGGAGMPTLRTTATWAPACESFVRDGKLVLRYELPGVDPKDVDIQVTGNTLTIKGERKRSAEVKEEGYLLKEFMYGGFKRSVLLPEGVEPEKVHASYHNGVLEIAMPVPSALAPRKVQIEIGSGSELRAA